MYNINNKQVKVDTLDYLKKNKYLKYSKFVCEGCVAYATNCLKQTHGEGAGLDVMDGEGAGV